jgi:hypothetical protein
MNDAERRDTWAGDALIVRRTEEGIHLHVVSFREPGQTTLSTEDAAWLIETLRRVVWGGDSASNLAQVYEILTLFPTEEPYPERLFPPLTDEQWAALETWCESQGFPIDRLSANYGRVYGRPYRDALRQIRELLSGGAA